MKAALFFVFVFSSFNLWANEVSLSPQWDNSGAVIKDPGLNYLFSTPDDEPNNYCDILFPGQRDMLNRYCIDPGWYAVMYDGVLMNARCYPSYESALEVMADSQVCEMAPPASVNQCEIMNAGDRDIVNRGCANLNKYAVSYDGYVLDGICFDTIDQAIRKARNTKSCLYVPPIENGRCTILNPTEVDRRGSRCVNTNHYNYVRDGYIMRNQCFTTLDQAVENMDNSRACQ
ncbi:MAG: hypothetical protein KDD50_16270 [Bdellovibrionales bacterium]|nr:hypothetical protein [Bdellovibrionales bacterium]